VRPSGPVGVALVLLLAGCQSQQEAYCSAVREERDTIVELTREADRGRDGVVEDSIAVFERLRDQAPDDLVDEWDTYLRAWRGLESALDRAGVSESQFRKGEQPEGVGDEQYAAVRAAAEQLRSPRVVDAASGIEQQAQDVCKVDLSGSQLG
jgi:hypothetical protein